MYLAPTEDMQFLIDDVLDVGGVLGALPQYAELGLGPDLTTALLDEAAKFAADVVSPLRRVGDAQPASCQDSAVTIPPGYGEAIRQLGAGGWVGISAPYEQGGQGLPELFGTAACEMWNATHESSAVMTIPACTSNSRGLINKTVKLISTITMSGTTNLIR